LTCNPLLVASFSFASIQSDDAWASPMPSSPFSAVGDEPVGIDDLLSLPPLADGRRRFLLFGARIGAAVALREWGWMGVCCTDSEMQLADLPSSCKSDVIPFVADVEAMAAKGSKLDIPVELGIGNTEDDRGMFNLVVLTGGLQALAAQVAIGCMRNLNVGGTLMLELRGLPKVRSLSWIWWLRYIFPVEHIRLHKARAAGARASSSYFLVAQSFAGAHVPGVKGLEEICSMVVSQGLSSLPLPKDVSVEHLKALCTPLEEDMTAVWLEHLHTFREDITAAEIVAGSWGGHAADDFTSTASTCASTCNMRRRAASVSTCGTVMQALDEEDQESIWDYVEVFQPLLMILVVLLLWVVYSLSQLFWKRA